MSEENEEQEKSIFDEAWTAWIIDIRGEFQKAETAILKLSRKANIEEPTTEEVREALDKISNLQYELIQVWLDLDDYYQKRPDAEKRFRVIKTDLNRKA